jgi:hypothetical protein
MKFQSLLEVIQGFVEKRGKPGLNVAALLEDETDLCRPDPLPRPDE